MTGEPSVDMSERTFKEHYIVAFLGTWAAQAYPNACALGNHEVFDHHPIEDAEDLANRAWKAMIESGITSKFKF